MTEVSSATKLSDNSVALDYVDFCGLYVDTANEKKTCGLENLSCCNEDVQEVVVEVGLDEETLLSYPKLLYLEAKVNHKDSTATCCSICLADYKNSDMLRLLPDCGHLFHLKLWLRLNPTCPVCRTSPLPTPQSTPLAEVVQDFCSTAVSLEIRVCS
ncbi:PREDICTED: RING-H2 finger protein ATL70-like [Nicotiana attenuata]|uniref:RING-H2 finger protein ATL70-like n=1 Tax=Nicotiana attenuata TaxID=49451 RepID=UPI0009053C36|nr:PREDICTED: RING-H2 finger protein ATL70-like [Nicotiana attenuata]